MSVHLHRYTLTENPGGEGGQTLCSTGNHPLSKGDEVYAHDTPENLNSRMHLICKRCFEEEFVEQCQQCNRKLLRPGESIESTGRCAKVGDCALISAAPLIGGVIGWRVLPFASLSVAGNIAAMSTIMAVVPAAAMAFYCLCKYYKKRNPEPQQPEQVHLVDLNEVLMSQGEQA